MTTGPRAQSLTAAEIAALNQIQFDGRLSLPVFARLIDPKLKYSILGRAMRGQRISIITARLISAWLGARATNTVLPVVHHANKAAEAPAGKKTALQKTPPVRSKKPLQRG